MADEWEKRARVLEIAAALYGPFKAIGGNLDSEFSIPKQFQNTLKAVEKYLEDGVFRDSGYYRERWPER